MRQRSTSIDLPVPLDDASEARRRLSGFVATAMEHEIEREELGSFLRAMDAELGPIPADVAAEVRSAWRKR
jgi:hypothetical protein